MTSCTAVLRHVEKCWHSFPFPHVQVLGERKRERIEQRKQAKEDELSKSQMEEEPVADNVKEIKP